MDAHDGSRPTPAGPPLYDLGSRDDGEQSAPSAPAADPSSDRRRQPPSVAAVAAISALVGALVAATVAAVLFRLDDDPLTVVPGEGDPAILVPEGRAAAFDPAIVAGVIAPSVVSVEGGNPLAVGVDIESGSGFITSSQGCVVTSSHVVDDMNEITVVLWDGRRLAATVEGDYPDRDIAVLRIDEVDGLVPARLGSSNNLIVGDEVIAVGNALGMGGAPTVTSGIVSAVHRSLDTGQYRLDDLIQTDAAINPGNSGGPLVDEAGAVVGINTAIVDGAPGIGFAVAVDWVRPLLDGHCPEDGGGEGPVEGDPV